MQTEIIEQPESFEKEAYYNALIDQIVNASMGNLFLSREDSIEYHGKIYDKFTFDIKSGSWGPRIQEFLIRTDETLFRNGIEQEFLFNIYWEKSDDEWKIVRETVFLK